MFRFKEIRFGSHLLITLPCISQDVDPKKLEYNGQTIATLSRADSGFGTHGKYRFIMAEMDDLEGIYKFLKSKGIKFRKL